MTEIKGRHNEEKVFQTILIYPQPAEYRHSVISRFQRTATYDECPMAYKPTDEMLNILPKQFGIKNT